MSFAKDITVYWKHDEIEYHGLMALLKKPETLITLMYA
jgi:hypothetical protein